MTNPIPILFLVAGALFPQVEFLDFPDLVDTARDERPVPISAWFPREKGPFPLVIFSHGGGGNRESHAKHAEYLAGIGYVVLCPEHVFSNRARLREHFRKARGTVRERFMEALDRIVKDPKAVLERPGDVRFAIDRAREWNENAGELRGKIDLDRIAVAGHSFGAYTTLAICGARPILDHLEPSVKPGRGLAGDLSDPRVDVGICMSPQGVGTSRFSRESFRTIDRPLLCFSGTKDEQFGSDGSLQDPILRLEGFRMYPEGDKVMVWLEGADHLAFADHARGNRIMTSKARRDTQRIVKPMMAIFLDAYLKGDREAKKKLNGDTASGFCGGEIPRLEWHER